VNLILLLIASFGALAFHPLPGAEPSPTEHKPDLNIDGHRLRSPDQPKPRWPKEAIADRWTGDGIIELHVHADGVVYDAQVSKSSGHELLDRAALQAFRQWRFQPEAADFAVKVPFKFEFLERPFTNRPNLTNPSADRYVARKFVYEFSS